MRIILRILFAIGFCGTLWGAFNVWLATHGTPEPLAVTLEELGAANGTSNVHVTIREFRVGQGIFSEKGTLERGARVWIPLLSPTGEWTPRPVVAWIDTLSTEAELEELLERRELHGVISNSIQSLGPSQQSILAKTYPNADLSHALAFNIDRSFPSLAVTVSCLTGGLLTLIVASGLIVREARQK